MWIAICVVHMYLYLLFIVLVDRDFVSGIRKLKL